MPMEFGVSRLKLTLILRCLQAAQPARDFRCDLRGLKSLFVGNIDTSVAHQLSRRRDETRIRRICTGR
jgi:hypothetical protein